MTEPITLHGYSYPFATLDDVIAHEARQGRTVRVAIQHAGGWAVAGEPPPDVAQDELTEECLRERAKRSILALLDNEFVAAWRRYEARKRGDEAE